MMMIITIVNGSIIDNNSQRIEWYASLKISIQASLAASIEQKQGKTHSAHHCFMTEP